MSQHGKIGLPFTRIIWGMPSEIFKRADTSFFVTSLASDTSHAGISTFEMTIGIDTAHAGSKHERAVQVLKHLLAQPDTDVLMIELLNYLYVENSWAARGTSEPFQRLKDRVLTPRGIQLTDDGFTLPDGRDVDQLERVAEPSHSKAEEVSAGRFQKVFGSGPVNPPWLTDPVAAPLPAALLMQSTPSPVTDKNKVFVVHGRDMRPVEVLKRYLLFLGLHMMPWSEAVRLTGRPQPHTYDVVMAGMEHSAAIVVIFSPDDLARVKDAFSEADDLDRTPQGQARQNVTLEAGMAFAMAPKRTIFLKSAETRDISDIDGFNWVKLDGEWDSRMDLKNRLESAGAAVFNHNPNLLDALAGPFRVLSSEPRPHSP